MGTQLILMIGTNPLPVWVAWQYLHKLLEPPVAVRLVYTEGTKDEVERLREEIPGASLLPAIKTSPGNPAVVRDNIRVAVEPLPPGTTHVHVHYTGGTKVMAVETVTGLEWYRKQLKGSFRVETSYLDPRGEAGPTLINQQGQRLVQDTRQAIAPNLSQIARLNGFVTGLFVYQYKRDGAWEEQECPAPRPLLKSQMQAGSTVLSEGNKGKWGDFDRTFAGPHSQWNVAFPQDPNTPLTYPGRASILTLPAHAGTWRQHLLPVLNVMCPQSPWDTAAGTLSYKARDSASLQEQQDLEHLHRFFKGIWLEYAAYDALRQALAAISKQNPMRTNYHLFHSVHIRRAESPHRIRRTQSGNCIKPFELDVVAILGYQLLVISCSVSHSVSRVEAEIKHKAMEVLLRSRQLGGDEARAIVLCRVHEDVASTIQAEVEDEMGSIAIPLQIWGFNRWKNLQEHLRKYLRTELYWR